MAKKFSNTKVLMAFIIRRNRVRLPLWIFAISIFTIAIAAMLPQLYTADTERMILAETMKNPAITFMVGPSSGLDNYTYGAMMGHFMLIFTGIFLAIMNIFLVVRHTREDEEEGRLEMINSLPVGPLSNLAATYLILIVSNILIFLLVSVGLYSLGLESMDLQGSILFAASISAVGIFYLALTGLIAQLTSNVRASLGFSFAFLIAEYIIRGFGDVGSNALSYISPLGLIARSQVYVNNLWWPILVLLIASILIFGLSLYLNSIRDLGAGFIATKSGKTHASRYLSSPLGLALRLERSSLIIWIVGMFILGATYGSLLGDLEGFLNTSDLIQQMLPNLEGMSLTENFIAMLITIVSVIGTIPVIIFIQKLNSEEKKGRISPLLASPVSRNSLMASYTLISIISAVVFQLMSVLGLWSAASLVMTDLISFQVILKAAFMNIPAMWIFTGLACFLIGSLPRFTGLTWTFLIYSFFIEYLGSMLELPEWMGKLSPFSHIPIIGVEDIKVTQLLIISAMAFVLIGLGFLGYNRRDIE